MKANGVRQAIDLAAQAADGLSAAHSVGIYHRDIKPQNVLVTPEGRVKLIDFGLAKDAVHTDGAQTLTADGTVMGTAPYMSPEQVRGQELDARSDLFSLGAVLYEQLAGQRPFLGETVAVTMSAVLNEEPAELPEKVPGGLKQIVYRCLAKDKAARFQNAADLSFALRALGAGSSTGHMQTMIAAPESKRGSRLGWAAAAIMTIATAAALWAPWRKPPEPARPVQFIVNPPKNMTFGDLNLAGPPLLSPDGSALLIPVQSEDRRTTLWVRPLDSVEARKLEGTDGATYPFWSPDSQQVAFFAGGKLLRVAATGGAVLPVCDAASGRGGAWSAAGGGMGTIVLAPSNTEPLVQVPAAGGTPKQITKFDPSRRERGHRFPVFLPDGRNFLYLSLSMTLGEGGLPVIRGSLDGGASHFLTNSDSRVLLLRAQRGPSKRPPALCAWERPVGTAL